jgi:hypothetical protein
MKLPGSAPEMGLASRPAHEPINNAEAKMPRSGNALQHKHFPELDRDRSCNCLTGFDRLFCQFAARVPPRGLENP